MAELLKRLKTLNIDVIFHEKTDDFFVQLFRIAFLVDWGSMVGMVTLGMNKYIAVAIAFILGLITNFILSKIFVFQEASERTNAMGEFIVYAIIGVIGLALTEGLMVLMLEVIGIYYMIAKVIAAIIVLLWNFIARKVLLYTNR